MPGETPLANKWGSETRTKGTSLTNPELERAGDRIINQLLSNPGVEERKSRFADRPPCSFVAGSSFISTSVGSQMCG